MPVAAQIMPATTRQEDLLKHFGARYRVVQSQNLHGLGVCLTDELFIKIEYNRPPEAATNHGVARHNPADTQSVLLSIPSVDSSLLLLLFLGSIGCRL